MVSSAPGGIAPCSTVRSSVNTVNVTRRPSYEPLPMIVSRSVTTARTVLSPASLTWISVNLIWATRQYE